MEIIINLRWIPTLSSGCKRSMNHLKEGLDHEAKHRCRYSAQYDNRIYTCKVRTNTHTLHVQAAYSRSISGTCGLRSATRGGRRSSLFPKPQPRRTRRGSVWPSTPGLGESMGSVSSIDLCPRLNRVHLFLAGTSSSAPTVRSSTGAGSTGTGTRTRWKRWSGQRSSTSGPG